MTSERIPRFLAFMSRLSSPPHRLSLMLCNHGNWWQKKEKKRKRSVFISSRGRSVIFCASQLREYLRIAGWRGVTCRGRVELLMHVSLPVIWRMILCASPRPFLAHQLISPTYSQLIAHTLWLNCTHLLYVCDWLQASSYPRCWSREFRGEVKRSLLLFFRLSAGTCAPKAAGGRRRSRRLCL